jgi:protein subunit release factor A
MRRFARTSTKHLVRHQSAAAAAAAGAPPLDSFKHLWPVYAALAASTGDAFTSHTEVPPMASVVVVTAARLGALVDNAPLGAMPPALVELKRERVGELALGDTLEPLVAAVQESRILLASPDAKDEEVAEIAREELAGHEAALRAFHCDEARSVVQQLLLSIEPGIARETSWILEVSGRAGGTEASLFAAELFETIKAYAEVRGWQFRPTNEEGNAGGQVARLQGSDIFPYMMHELGTHRVQRVPVTEASGRMQTSTAAVTLLPESAQPSVEVREEDCVIEMARGSGPGGQGVNSSSNAVHMKHKASGITVHCHESRSASENRRIALQKVSQELWKLEQQKCDAHNRSVLASQWVSGERSERIRTYNYPQGRVTDHRAKRWSSNRVNDFVKSALGLEELHLELQGLHAVKELPRAADAAVERMLAQGSPLVRAVMKATRQPEAVTIPDFLANHSATKLAAMLQSPEVVANFSFKGG